MQVKEVQRIEKQYICDTCGAKHKKKDDIFTSELSGKEICTKCSKKVSIYNPKIEMLETSYVHKDEVAPNYEYWEEEYLTAIYAEEKLYEERINTITREYLANNEDYLRNLVQ